MHDLLTSQFRASLAMLRRAIERCPDDLWTDRRFGNPSWRLAYHVLFYADLYLGRGVEDFSPWEKAIPGSHFMDQPIDPTATIPSRDDVLGYLEQIDASVAGRLHETGFDDSSGFEWIPLTRGELHIYNIRHLQHHTGQLIERLRAETGRGVDWVGTVR